MRKPSSANAMRAGRTPRSVLWRSPRRSRRTSGRRHAGVPGSAGGENEVALPREATVGTPDLPEPTTWERMLSDYRTTSLSVGVHPLELMRPHLPPGTLSTEELAEQPNNANVAVAGMGVPRQLPSTANGFVFMLLEDEHAQINLIVPPKVYDRFRAVIRGEPLL